MFLSLITFMKGLSLSFIPYFAHYLPNERPFPSLFLSSTSFITLLNALSPSFWSVLSLIALLNALSPTFLVRFVLDSPSQRPFTPFWSVLSLMSLLKYFSSSFSQIIAQAFRFSKEVSRKSLLPTNKRALIN